MTDGRSPRIHPALALWTLVLIGLVLAEVGHLQPGLTVLLVPYLALMAGHWVGRLRKRAHGVTAMPLDDAADRPCDDEPADCADSPGSGGRAGCDDPPEPGSPHPTDGQATPPSRRVRARRRPRAPEAGPLAASWVQVRPGRFVRVEEMPPEHPADEPAGDSRPDESDGVTPSEEPVATLEAGQTPADADTEESGSEVEVSQANEVATDATVPLAP
jgi:hypothetical protein